MMSDATQPRTRYQIALNQWGHAFVGLLTAQGLSLAGVSGWWAILLWAGLWEGWQLWKKRRATRQVRRRWDAVTDAIAYTSGAFLWYGWGEPLGFFSALALVGAVVAGSALIWAED